MANILDFDKQVTVVGMLCEGASIRSIERMTGIHRDTVMRLGVRVGNACQELVDASMRDLPCSRVEIDEIWGFVGKKDSSLKAGDDTSLGSVWTFVAIDPATKAVPAFAVGKRDAATTERFVTGVSARMRNRIQLSSDAMNHYAAAVETAFGSEVDYGQIVKTYRSSENEGRYSSPGIESVSRKAITGEPDRIGTSIIERQNLTMRMHCRRLTRLTNAFSKKLENFSAAVALHFGYYNFVKIHASVRCTPAMALGVASRLWKVEDLVALAA